MSNSYKRINKATSELDRAEERLLYSLGLSDEIINYFSDLLKGGQINYDLEEILDKNIGVLTNSQVDAIHRLRKSFAIGGAVSSAIDEYYKNGKGRASVGVMADTAMYYASTRLTPIVGEILLALDILNLADEYLFGNTKLFDLKNHALNFYDKLTNTTSDLPTVRNGVISITMPNGETYERPIQNAILKRIYGNNNGKFSLFGDSKNDVLFGGNGNDMLIGHGGADLLIGDNGKDDYFVDNGDTIKDSDGKGRVFLSSTNIQLTGGTQIEKGSKIYKGKDGVKYELKGSDLIINDSITIENFKPYADEYLGITLYKADEITVNVSNANAVEKAGKMSFTISLSRELKENEFVKVTIPKIGNNEAKTYMFLHYSNNDSQAGDGVEVVYTSSRSYEYSWSDDSLLEPDETISVKATIVDVSDGLIAKDGKIGIGTIQDDDDDPDNPNDTFPDTRPCFNQNFSYCD